MTKTSTPKPGLSTRVTRQLLEDPMVRTLSRLPLLSVVTSDRDATTVHRGDVKTAQCIGWKNIRRLRRGRERGVILTKRYRKQDNGEQVLVDTQMSRLHSILLVDVGGNGGAGVTAL